MPLCNVCVHVCDACMYTLMYIHKYVICNHIHIDLVLLGVVGGLPEEGLQAVLGLLHLHLDSLIPLSSVHLARQID